MPFDLQSLKKELQPSALKERAQNINDRYTSPSTASTGYNSSGSSTRPRPSTKPPPPLPPSSARKPATAVGSGPPPPLPPGRTLAPGLPRRDNSFNSETSSPASSSTGSRRSIDWSHLTSHDKNEFFTLLDGFFSSRQGVASALRVDPGADVVAPPLAPQMGVTRADVPSHANNQPPPPPLWARPPAFSTTVNNANSDGMSYPNPCQTTSHAHDAALYFSSNERWHDTWFTSDEPLPPSLAGRTDMTWTCSWRTHGNSKTLIGAALFSDLSVLWYKVDWDVSQERPSDFTASVQKEARYLDRPEPFAAEELWYACSTYGEQVALFAEEAERQGRPIGHGECWDMASAALASVKDLPAPVPSISRTHGHLIFSGSANGKDPKRSQQGRWRGGDTNVRRGDIVEWRKVRLSAPDGRGWSDLGNPDHTAVIVNTYLSSDPQANSQAKDGDSVAPWEVGILEVVEQSQGKVPKRAEYNLAGMESGEIWIYRPVSMLDYIGIDQLQADWEQPSSRGVIQYVG